MVSNFSTPVVLIKRIINCDEGTIFLCLAPSEWKLLPLLICKTDPTLLHSLKTSGLELFYTSGFGHGFGHLHTKPYQMVSRLFGFSNGSLETTNHQTHTQITRYECSARNASSEPSLQRRPFTGSTGASEIHILRGHAHTNICTVL